MSDEVEFPGNKERNSKQKQFKGKFPNKAAVEARINAAIDGATNIAELKVAIKEIFNGKGNKPGIVDALFHLDR